MTPRRHRRIARLLLAAVFFCLLQDGAAAQYASGGYRRPSPGYSAPAPRPPASSGGYARPSVPSSGYSSGSAGDRAVSRRGSAQALQDFQASQRPRPDQRTPSPWGSGNAAPAERRPTPWGGATTPPVDRRPSPARGWGGPSAGAVVNGVMLWALLNSLTSPGRAEYFRAHRDNPEYLRWRQEAEARAAQDPQVAAQLNQLDQELAQPAPRSSVKVGTGILWLVLLGGGAILVFLWLSRRAAGGTTGTGATAGRPPPPGSAEAGFRVGMTFPIDPSPFLLAGSATKVQAPPGGMTNVEAVGTLRGAGVVLHRLYLPGRQGFFQVHTDAAGAIDECRYFSLLDEVTPADAREWGVWLDPAEGMIGWPAFQTRDGKTYGRAWVPGGGRVSPQMLDETVQALDGTAQRRLQAMLYAAPTGAAPPAPPTEFVMVAAIQAADQAWVEIHAGIDVNPAALALPAAPDRRSA